MKKSNSSGVLGIIGGAMAVCIAVLIAFVFIFIGALLTAFGGKLPAYFNVFIVLMIIGGFLGIIGGGICFKNARIGGIVEIVGAFLMCFFVFYSIKNLIFNLSVYGALCVLACLISIVMISYGGIKAFIISKKN